jgi:hypothetical protein
MGELQIGSSFFGFALHVSGTVGFEFLLPEAFRLTNTLYHSKDFFLCLATFSSLWANIVFIAVTFFLFSIYFLAIENTPYRLNRP